MKELVEKALEERKEEREEETIAQIKALMYMKKEWENKIREIKKKIDSIEKTLTKIGNGKLTLEEITEIRAEHAEVTPIASDTSSCITLGGY